MDTPTLYIMSGLPATGKTTLSKKLAAHVNALFLRIDTVEQALTDLCQIKVEGEGYRLSYRIAEDNLKLGLSVIADSVNPIELTRHEWEAVATASGARFRNIEIICSNRTEHQSRVEQRQADFHAQKAKNALVSARAEPPSWQDVMDRKYDDWEAHSQTRLRIDTAGKPIDESFNELVAALSSE